MKKTLCYRNKGTVRRCTAFLLAALLGVSSPVQAMASVNATSQNTPEKNRQILSTLQAITGDAQSAREIYSQLKTLNLFDDSGNLVTENLLVDGEEKTVWEVLEMIEGMDEAKLDKTAVVAGRKISFRDLKTMAEIEAELARIQSTYFNRDIQLTDEQNASLDSLYRQLETEGISIQGFADTDGAIQFASGIDRENMLSVTAKAYDASGAVIATGSENEDRIAVPNQAGKVVLNVALKEAADYPVYFQVRTLDGSAKAGTNYSKKPQVDSAYVNNREGAETGDNLVSCVIPAGEVSVSVTVDLQAADNGDRKMDSWTGERMFFLEFQKPENSSFDGETSSIYKVCITGNANLTEPGVRWSKVYWNASGDGVEGDFDEIHRELDPTAEAWLRENRHSGELLLRKEAFLGDSSVHSGGWGHVSGTKYVFECVETGTTVRGGDQRIDLFPNSLEMGFVFNGNEEQNLALMKKAAANRVNLENILEVPRGAEYFCDPDWTNGIGRKTEDSYFLNPLDTVSDSRNLGELDDALLDELFNSGFRVRFLADGVTYDPGSESYTSGVPIDRYGKTHVGLSIQIRKPRLISVKVQPGHYLAGSKVPLLLEFSHPIGVKTKPAGAGKLELAESVNTSSKYLTVLADCGSGIFSDPNLEQIVTLKELIAFMETGSYQDAWTNDWMSFEKDAALDKIDTTGADFMQDLESALDAGLLPVKLPEGNVIRPDQNAVKVQIPIDQNIYNLLANTGKPDEENKIYTGRLAVSADGKEFQQLYFADASGNPVTGNAVLLTGTVPLPVNAGENDVRGAVELYLMDQTAAEWTPERVVMNLYGEYTRQAAVLMTGEHMEILYPQGFPEDTEGDKNNEIFPDTENIQQILKLGWSRKPDSPANLTWPEDVSWAPADAESEKVAMIDANGQVTLTGASGQARFVLTAENGGFTPREGEEESLYQVLSKPIRVGVGNTPFLFIPETSKTISVQAGQPALVMWQTNLFDKNGIANEDREFETAVTLKLYKAVYDENGNFLKDASLQNDPVQGPFTVTGTQNNPVNEYVFQDLEKLQEKGRHSYVFTVEMEADKAVSGAGQPLKAEGYIDVSARPASVAVSRPEGGLYQTDEKDVMTLNWNTADVDPVDGAEAYVAVTDNTTGEKVFEKHYSNLKADVQEGDANGTVTFPLHVENGFRTTYTVEAKIKNANDTGWSTDSYQLSLYHAKSLKLLVNGVETREGETITISNREMIASMDSEEILDLNRQIFLQSDLSINHEEYNWQDLEDRMKWSAETKDGQGDVAEIQTMYGSKYFDIREVNFETYSPSQEQLLVGVSDGTAQVAVEHHFNEKLKADVEVEIQTLKDRLYLFQFYPMRETRITYFNGNGEKKTVFSNEEGELAVYEESGISSDVYARSESALHEIYMGTVYKETLVTSEKDAGSLELYPLNVLQLKKASSVPLAFKTPDGKPYEGEITVRGGVLMNGIYDEEITIDQHDGAEDYILSPGADGSHVFEFDMTQFPEEYTENAIQFVFEFRFEDNAYEPVYLELDGSINSEALIRMAQNIVSLRAYKSDELQPITVQKRLFFSNTASGSYRNVIDLTGRTGPGTNNPDVTLETIGVWWGSERGEQDATRSLIYLDKYGKALPSQTSKLIDYPFLSMPVLRNVLVMDKKAMEAMELDMGQTMPMDLVYRESEETVLRQETSKLWIINMLGVEDVTDSDRLSIILSEMTSASSNNSEVKFANSMAGLGMALATKLSIVNTENLRLQLLPTADPSRFEGFVSIGLNNMVGDNVTGLDPQYDKAGDLDYLPGLSEVKGLLKNGLANTVKDEKNLVKYAGALLKDQGKKGIANGYSSNGTLKDGAPYYALQGYFETEVFYDYENEKWEMAVLNGGFTVGGGYGKDWKWNSFVGPVPVLAELGFGAGIAVDFQAAVDRQAMVNEYLTELRIMAYLRAFAGIGFDYAIIALKLGLYGQINLDARINFLNSRDNISTPKVGLYLGGSGEFGILFAVKFLFISYQKILVGVSGEIGHTNNAAYSANLEYWETVKNGKSGQDYPMIEAEAQAAAALVNEQIQQIPQARLVMRDEASDLNIYEVPIDATLEERDYLELFDRSWNLETEEEGFLSRLAEGAKKALRSIGLMKPEPPKNRDSEGAGVSTVWENAYPYANPEVSEDGRFLAYLTDQGETDVTKTRVAVRDLEQGSTEQIISNDGYGDNYLTVAGSGENTVMAWGRSTINLKKDPGSVITDAEQNQMMASAEIMAARWNEEAETWEVKQLTDNTVGDVSPAVATNGTRTVVAWRRGAGTDSSQVTNFNARDEIVYRVYESGKGSWTDDAAWSKEQILYNGVNGTASGLEAAMLPDGTAGVVFAVDTAKAENGASGAARYREEGVTPAAAVNEETGEVNSLVEIMFGTIEKDTFNEDKAESTRLIRVTSDEYLDENPQIAAVQFRDLIAEEDSGQRFVLGWHSIQSFNGIQQNDIQLRAFSGMGVMENSFPSAVSRISNSASALPGAIFRFSKGADTLEELSILWKEPAVEVYEEDEGAGETGETETVTGKEAIDYDVLRAMRFITEKSEEDGKTRYGMTAAQIIASMGDQTVIENFDPYLTENGILSAMILGSCYDTPYTEDFPVDFGNGTVRSTVSMAKPVSSIYRASGNYQDQLTVDFVIPDYRILYKNSRIPVQIGVSNQGTSAVTKIEVTFEDQTAGGILGMRAANQQTETFVFGGENQPAPLLPGESRTLTAYYEIGDKITDVNYTVKTTFAKAKTSVLTEGTDEMPQVMKLDIPDLGISGFEVKQAQNGKRLLQISLYNDNEAKLAETSHERVVKLGLYTDAECTNPVDARYLTEIQTRSGEKDGAIKTLNIKDNKLEFEMIDNGAYTVQYEFDIAEFIANADPEEDSFRSEDGEIRENGIDLYAMVWAEDEDQEEDPAEFVTSNNVESVHLESLINLAGGELASVITSLKNPKAEEAGTGSQVTVTVQNNSIKEESSGNLIVTLLDANGKILEAKQLYQKNAPNNGLLRIPGEGIVETTFYFTKTGVAAKAYYSNDILDTSTDIKEITLEETSLGLDKFTPYNESSEQSIRVADIDADNLYGSQLVIKGSNTASAVKVEGAEQVETTEGGEAGWYIGNVELRPGKVSQLVIQANEENEQGELVPVTYIVNVINRYVENEEMQQTEETGVQEGAGIPGVQPEKSEKGGAAA